MTAQYLIPVRTVIPEGWSRDVFDLVSLDSVLDRVGIRSIEFRTLAEIQVGLVFPGELVIARPGLFGIELVFGSEEEGLTELDLLLSLSGSLALTILDIPFKLRFPRDLLQPVVNVDGAYHPDPDPTTRVELGVTSTLTFFDDGNIESTGVSDIVVSPDLMVANSGLVISVPGLDLYLSQDDFPPPGLSDGWRGVYIDAAQINYHKEQSDTRFGPINLEHAAIGGGGFSGNIGLGDAEEDKENPRDLALDGPDTPTPDDVQEIKLAGARAFLQYIEITLNQSIPVASRLTGHLFVPFVDTWMKFVASIGGPDGDFMLELGGAGGEALISLDNDWLEIKVDSIAYSTRDGVHYAVIAGSVRPKFGDDWPWFKVEKLLISSEGDIEIEGGWIDVPEKVTIDFYGFKLDVSQLGFGKGEDASQWMGFSGEIALLEGLPLSGSVEGLKFTWYPDDPGRQVDSTLEGIGVHLDVPEVITIDGAVAYKEVHPDDAGGGLDGHLFKGHVDLDLPALKLEIGGELVIGRMRDATGRSFSVFYIVLDADLPKPIPLGATGAGIYGMAGLFGLHISPDRLLSDGQPEAWYAWYKKADRGEDSAYDVTAITKWAPQFDHYAFGAGLTLGTQFDDGYSLNVKALVVILIPGPVVMIEGKANLLKGRSDDPKAEGNFYALAVFDGGAGTFQLNVDAKYNLKQVVDISGGIEAFFDFTNLSAWYLHLGVKEPESKRIRAEILALFSANTYLMLSGSGLQFGAAIGFNWKAELGPVSLTLNARISLDAGIFWKPLQLTGTLSLYGELALKVFGIGFGIIIEALLEGRAPAPYWIHGLIRVALSLPWPLPDVEVKAELEWEQRIPPQPVTPFLKDAAMIHHKLPSTGWTLATREAGAPVVPVDARPVLSFARPITGFSLTAAGEPVGPDRVDDREFSYTLADVRLEVKERGAWQPIRTGLSDPGDGQPWFDLHARRHLLPGPDAQEPQLQLWGSSPLDVSTRYWREAYPDAYLPCPPMGAAPELCADWRNVPDNTTYPLEFRHRQLRFVADMVRDEQNNLFNPHVIGATLHSPNLRVRLPEPAGWLQVTTDDIAQGMVVRVQFYHAGRLVETRELSGTDHSAVITYSSGVDALRLEKEGDVSALIPLRSICYKTARALAAEQTPSPGVGAGPFGDDADEQGGLILKPGRTYRLQVTTGDRGTTPDESAAIYYFRTADGLPNRFQPAGSETAHANTILDKLATYVGQTTPVHGDRNHYHSYDLAVEFNEPYVEHMFTQPLHLRLRNRNGRLVSDPGAEWQAGWGSLLRAGWLTWVAAIESGGCGDGPAAPPAPRLSHTPLPLAPNRMYTAELIRQNVPNEPVYSFQFTTSHYPTVVEHLTSGLQPDGQQVVRPALANNAPDTGWFAEHLRYWRALEQARERLAIAAAAGEVAEELENTRTALDTLNTFSAKTFAALYDQMFTGHRPLPPALEFVQIKTTATLAQCLLLESPEPLDWARISLECRNVSGGINIALRLVWSNDQTRAFIFRNNGTGFTPGGYQFVFQYTGEAYRELPRITHRGESVNAEVICPVSIR